MKRNLSNKSESSRKLRDALKGPVVALTTPFKEDLTINFDGLRKIVNYYAESGIRNVIAAGSTGEFNSLTDEERRSVIKTVVEESAGCMTVIGCAAHSGTDLAMNLAHYCKEIGCDGVMVTPPYYGFSGFEGLKRHFEIISDNVDLGIVIYFSGSVLRFPLIQELVNKSSLQCADEIIELMSVPNVGAFKDASGNFRFLCNTARELDGPDGIISVMGSAGMAYYLWGSKFGASSFLTGLGNIWPKIELKFYQMILDNNDEDALKIINDFDLPYLAATAGTGRYFAAVKALLDLVGLPGGPMRPPHLDLSEKQTIMLRDSMKRIGLI